MASGVIDNALNALCGSREYYTLQNGEIKTAPYSTLNEHAATFFTNWYDSTNFPEAYGSGVWIPALDGNNKHIIYCTTNNMYKGFLTRSGSTVSVIWKKVTLTSV